METLKRIKKTMAKQHPLLKLDLPLYSMEEVNRVMDACKALDYTGQQLLEQALSEFLDNHKL